MSIEIEKKYRLTNTEREQILAKLKDSGAQFAGEDFETNVIFTGGILSLKEAVLRLRTTQTKTVLTYKESLPSASQAKRRTEHETVVTNADAMNQIILSLGYKPGLIYEKRRQTWHFETVEITVDDLPFGFYLEIEGAETDIFDAETKLNLTNLTHENESYPALTRRFGKHKNNVYEARFEPEKS